jgi:hypothetical protein
VFARGILPFPAFERKDDHRRFEMNDAFPIDASPGFISITNPFDGVEVGTVVNIPPGGAQALIQTAKEGARVCRNLSRHERARVLEICASLVERDKDAFADLIVAEAGKTIRQASKEVLRCVNTLKLSADEARRNVGEVVPFDAYGGSENRQGWFTRVHQEDDIWQPGSCSDGRIRTSRQASLSTIRQCALEISSMPRRARSVRQS